MKPLTQKCYIEKRLELVSLPPWICDGVKDEYGVITVFANTNTTHERIMCLHAENSYDYDFVLHSRADIEYLLRELKILLGNGDNADSVLGHAQCMPDAKLDKIEHRANHATPGPWLSYIEGRDHEGGSNFIMTGVDESRGDDIEISGSSVEDQDFVAEARQCIPCLISEIRRLKNGSMETE